MKKEVKALVADCVESNPTSAIGSKFRGPFDALVAALEKIV